MLLRCCNDELRGSPQRLPDAATQRSRKKIRQDPVAVLVLKRRVKRSLHNDVSGKVTHGCSDAVFMHASLKLRSHRDAR